MANNQGKEVVLVLKRVWLRPEQSSDRNYVNQDFVTLKVNVDDRDDLEANITFCDGSESATLGISVYDGRDHQRQEEALDFANKLEEAVCQFTKAVREAVQEQRSRFV